MKIVTIKRSKWSRGEQTVFGENYLLVSREKTKSSDGIPTGLVAGNMCCLGFVCLAEGALPEDILGITFPKYVDRDACGLPDVLTGRPEECASNPEFVREAAVINDDRGITEEEREQQLIDLAAEHGYKFQFVD